MTVGDLAGFLFSAVTGGIPTAVKWAVGNQIADSIPPIQEARQEIMKGAINAIVPVIVPVVAPAVGFVAGAVPGGDSLTHPDIQMVERTGPDPYQHLSFLGLGIGVFRVQKLFRTSVLSEEDGLHKA